jgi:hypothetical protein
MSQFFFPGPSSSSVPLIDTTRCGTIDLDFAVKTEPKDDVGEDSEAELSIDESEVPQAVVKSEQKDQTLVQVKKPIELVPMFQKNVFLCCSCCGIIG